MAAGVVIADTIGKVVLAEGLKRFLNSILEGSDEKKLSSSDKKNIISAITAIQNAIIITRKFIDAVGYESNEELTALWHDALNKSVEANIGEGLPDYLYQKAKFWGKPQDWIDNPASLELVPKLRFLDDECDMLMLRITKK